MPKREIVSMSLTLQNLKAASSALSAAERAELVRFLLHSLEECSEPDAKAEWLALVEKRMAEVRSGKVVGIPAEKVISSLLEISAMKPLKSQSDLTDFVPLEYLELLQDLLARQRAEQLARRLDWNRLIPSSPPPPEWFEEDEPKPF
jgi:putative addiction module component (TIGR02574 family)